MLISIKASVWVSIITNGDLNKKMYERSYSRHRIMLRYCFHNSAENGIMPVIVTLLVFRQHSRLTSHILSCIWWYQLYTFYTGSTVMNLYLYSNICIRPRRVLVQYCLFMRFCTSNYVCSIFKWITKAWQQIYQSDVLFSSAQSGAQVI